MTGHEMYLLRLREREVAAIERIANALEARHVRPENEADLISKREADDLDAWVNGRRRG